MVENANNDADPLAGPGQLDPRANNVEVVQALQEAEGQNNAEGQDRQVEGIPL